VTDACQDRHSWVLSLTGGEAIPGETHRNREGRTRRKVLLTGVILLQGRYGPRLGVVTGCSSVNRGGKPVIVRDRFHIIENPAAKRE